LEFLAHRKDQGYPHQDNTKLEEQLLPFDGSLILWFLTPVFLHLAHFTHLSLAW
jgi:hypothetical protein